MTNTYYINYKSGKKFTLTKTDEETNRAVITDEDGNHKLVSLSTLKKTYKKVTEEVEEPKKSTKKEQKKDAAPEFNHHKAVAKNNLTNAYAWVVGGYENSVTDGASEEVPPVEDMFSEVYETAMTSECHEGAVYMGHELISMRLAGKQFCLDVLTQLFQEDGYEVPESCYTIKPKGKLEGPRKNIKGNPDDVQDGQVVMVAFTGMVIGVFDIKKETKKTITVKTAKGDLKFDKATGLQMDADNPKFANRLNIQ